MTFRSRAKEDLGLRFDVVLVALLHVRQQVQWPVPCEVADMEHRDAAGCRQVEVVARVQLIPLERQRLELHLVDPIWNRVR